MVNGRRLTQSRPSGKGAKMGAGTISYKATISACEKGQEWQVALGFSTTMVEQADTISYVAAMSACEKGQEWQLALGLFSAMVSADVEANTSQYNAAISACEKGQEWQHPLGLLSTMARVASEMAHQRKKKLAKL